MLFPNSWGLIVSLNKNENWVRISKESEGVCQDLSQDLEIGCPKLANLGCPIFQGSSQYTQSKTINMYLLHEVKHNVHI